MTDGDAQRRQDNQGEAHCCSFCNKSQDLVRKLIAGPSCSICDECVEICSDIISTIGRQILNLLALGQELNRRLTLQRAAPCADYRRQSRSSFLLSVAERCADHASRPFRESASPAPLSTTRLSRWIARLPNKELKLTKPSIMELRSLTLCSVVRLEVARDGHGLVPRLTLPLLGGGRPPLHAILSSCSL